MFLRRPGGHRSRRAAVVSGAPSDGAISGFQLLLDEWVADCKSFSSSGLSPNDFKIHDPLSRIRITPKQSSLDLQAVYRGGSEGVGIWNATTGAFVTQVDFSGAGAGVKSTVTASGLVAGTAYDIEFGTLNGTVGSELTGLGSASQSFILGAVSPPANRVVIYGDSIPRGYNADTGATRYQGWVGLIKRILAARGYGFTNYSKFGRSLGDAVETSGANQAATIAALGARLDGTSSNILLYELGYNDYHSSIESAADYQTLLGGFLDAFHVAYPAATVILQTMIVSGFTGNNTFGAGNNLENYRAVERTVQSTRSSYVSLIEGVTDIALLLVGDLTDNIHPNSAGHNKIGNFYQGYFGATRTTSFAGSVAGMTGAMSATVTNPFQNFKAVAGANTKVDLQADTGITIGGTPLAAGTSPPAVTWSGALTAAANYVPFLQCDGAGVRAVATFKVSWDGGSTFALTGQPIASGSLALTTPLGNTLTVSFPSAAYLTDNTYTATCSAWLDQSGNGLDFSNATASSQPTIISGALNGHLGLKFDGTDDFIRATTTAVAPGTKPAFLWMLMKHSTWTSGDKICGGSNNGLVIFQSATTPKLRQFTGTNAGQASLTLGTYKRVQAFYTNSTTDFIQAGANQTAGTGSGNVGATDMALGCSAAGAAFSDCTIVSFGWAENWTPSGSSAPGAETGDYADLNTVATNIGGASMVT